MGGKCDLCDFNHGMIAGARLGWFKCFNLLDILYIAVSRVYTGWCEKQKNILCTEEQHILLMRMREIREE